MKTTALLLSCLIASLSLSSAARQAPMPNELIDVMQSATLHLDFSLGSITPEFGSTNPPQGQASAVIQLPEGKAFFTKNGERLRFTKSDALDFSHPGTLALWVSPRGWQWGNERPYNAFFNAVWEGGGSLKITRQGLLHPQGEAVRRNDRILLSFRGSAKDKPLTVMLGTSDAKNWADGSWHLLVLTWDGPTWSVSIDAEGRKYFNPSSAVRQQASFSIGGTQERTAFKAFTIFNKSLSNDAITILYRSQRPEN